MPLDAWAGTAISTKLAAIVKAMVEPRAKERRFMRHTTSHIVIAIFRPTEIGQSKALPWQGLSVVCVVAFES